MGGLIWKGYYWVIANHIGARIGAYNHDAIDPLFLFFFTDFRQWLCHSEHSPALNFSKAIPHKIGLL